MAVGNDAWALLSDTLNRYGLSSLSTWAWDQIVQGKSDAEISLSLYDQPAFKQRFPAIEGLRKAGKPGVTPAEYLAYEKSRGQIMRAAGFPPSFFDSPDDATNDLMGGVSVSELQTRASIYQKAAYDAPVEVRQQLKELYGIGEGDIAAYFADPNRALPVLQQKFTAAQIAGQAQRQQFGPLSQTEAERLAQLGVSDQQAATGFAQVSNAHELFGALPGEAGSTPGRSDALGLVGGDAAAQQKVDAQARKRKATFAGAGGYASSQAGVTGLGSAAT